MKMIEFNKQPLSARQFEIAESLVFKGTKKEVSEDLGITVRTVETQAKLIYEKLKITKLNELVLWYCATTFNIKKDIDAKINHFNRKKKEIGIAITMSLFVLISTTFEHDMLSRRERRFFRREYESNIVVNNTAGI